MISRDDKIHALFNELGFELEALGDKEVDRITRTLDGLHHDYTIIMQAHKDCISRSAYRVGNKDLEELVNG
jgi:hypothetical protein